MPQHRAVTPLRHGINQLPDQGAAASRCESPRFQSAANPQSVYSSNQQVGRIGDAKGRRYLLLRNRFS